MRRAEVWMKEISRSYGKADVQKSRNRLSMRTILNTPPGDVNSELEDLGSAAQGGVLLNTRCNTAVVLEQFDMEGSGKLMYC